MQYGQVLKSINRLLDQMESTFHTAIEKASMLSSLNRGNISNIVVFGMGGPVFL